MHRIRKYAAIGLGTITAVVLAAFAGILPASAATAGNPAASQTVNVSVATTITITGLQNVTFSNVIPGQTATVSPAETFTVISNDGNGFNLDESAGLDSFEGPGTSTAPAIPDSDWTINGDITTVNGSEYTLSPLGPPSGGTIVYNTNTGPSNDTFQESWSLAIPSTLVAGTYNNTLTYLAAAN